MGRYETAGHEGLRRKMKPAVITLRPGLSSGYKRFLLPFLVYYRWRDLYVLSHNLSWLTFSCRFSSLTSGTNM